MSSGLAKGIPGRWFLGVFARMRLLVSLAALCTLAIHSNAGFAIEPIGYTSRFDGTVQAGPPDPCTNSSSYSEALSCACNAWNRGAVVCPGFYTQAGNQLVPDQSGRIHMCSFNCSASGVKVSAAALCPGESQAASTFAGSSTCVVAGKPPPEENLGKPKPENVCPTPNPVHPGTGNKFRVETDYVGSAPMPLQFSRTYNADSAAPNTAMGARWVHTYERRVRSSGLSVRVYRPDGSSFLYTSTSINAPFQSTSDRRDRLERVADAQGQTMGWRFSTYPGDEIEEYDVIGKLMTIRNRAGLAVTLTYSESTTPPSTAPTSGFLLRVEGPMGRSLDFAYDPNGRIRSMTDPGGSTFTYEYDSLGNLVTVTNPDGTARHYHYGEPSLTSGAYLPQSMTGITDENGARFASFGYDALGRAVSSELAGGAERVELSYLAGGASTVKNYVNATLSSLRNYVFSNVNGVAKNSEISGGQWQGCGPKARSFDNATGFPTSTTDWNGHVTTYEYDPVRGLETLRTEAAETPQARTITTEWHASFNLPTHIVEPGRETTMSYDAAGNMLSRSVHDTATNETRTWIYTYNTNGQVLTVDGPRSDVTDVTTYTYYANDDPDLGKRGNLATVRNAAGHLTQILAYNAHGQPTEIRDPNGLTTTLAYDARQRLVSRQAGNETSTYTYDGVGQLTRVTLPDASHVDYTYDAAHRLTQIQDSAGNKIVYTLDAMGNRVQEQTFDPSKNLARTLARVYDSLNRLQQYIGAQ